MISLLLAAQLAAVPCTTVQPSPAFVCVDGGWLPPGHPNIPKAPPPPAPAPPTPEPPKNAPLVVEFQVGKTYRRDATGALLYIVALGTGRGGVALLAAECVVESRQDQCFFAGQGRLFYANASTSGWTLVE